MVTGQAPRALPSSAQPVSASQRRHIVLVAPPWYPVPPRGYGGIENVVALLAVELRRQGQQVTLIAAEGSGLHAMICAPAEWRSALGQPDERLRELAYAANVVRTIRQLNDVDVIHDHVGFATLAGCLQARIAPVVHTEHGVVLPAEADFYAGSGDQLRLVSISQSQRRRLPHLPWVGTVANAVAVDDLMVDQRAAGSDPYLLCLARICPDKGQHIAIEVARRTGIPLILAGKVDRSPESRRYFEQQVQPALDGSNVSHVPNVAGVEKAWLLAHATAQLAPIQWDEPFGLSVVESMVSGTPAISFARGAAPELIEEGATGFLVHDADGMAEAVRRVGDIDRARCAARARARFSPWSMAAGYLRVYDEAIAGARTLPGRTQALRLSVAGQFPPGRTAANDGDIAAVPVNADVA
jgi:glycosyltransferase involved in cell wall biosynthesis